MDRHRIAFMVVLLMTFVAPRIASAQTTDTYWFTNDGINGDGFGNAKWSTASNWDIDLHLPPSSYPGLQFHLHGLPGFNPAQASEDHTYITSAAIPHLGPGGNTTTLLPPTVIFQPVPSTTTVTTSALYIGGWIDAFDGLGYGNLDNSAITIDYEGTLAVNSGTLQTSAITTPGASPPCQYIRIGYRTRGTLNQTGGTVSSCTYLSMGFGSRNGTGIWNLRGGTVQAFGFDIGAMGVGVLDISGGTVLPLNSTSGQTNVGEGYRVNPKFGTGVGLVNQTHGSVTQTNLYVADGIGSAGVYTLRKNGQLTVTNELRVGNRGNGSFVQMEGSSTASKNAYVSFSSDAAGMFSISGGTFSQGTSGAGAFYNGYEAGARGSVVASGKDFTMTLRSYVQAAGSRLNMVLVPESPYISTITTSQAEFAAGAVLDVDIMSESQPGSAPSFTPANPQTFRLMTATSTFLNNGLVLAPEDVTDWKIKVVSSPPNTHLDVKYCPGYAQNAALCP